MKKSLIALAVISATGAAMAQSSVELFGRLDVGYSSNSVKVDGVKSYMAGTNTSAGSTQQGINSSNLNTQFWGLRGTEDLGGGLKAMFMLQSNFNTDTGALGGQMFDREAWLGLSGGFGTVKLGRNYTAYDTVRAATNHTLNSNINVTSVVSGVGVADFALRNSNSIRYEAPKMGGFNAAVSYGFGENKTTAESSRDTTSLALWYTEGPLLVAFGHQREEDTAANGDRKYTMVGGSYNFGIASLTGSYETSKQLGRKDKNYQFGVNVPMGAFSFHVGYADGQTKDGGVKADSSGYALVGTYALSKRTTAYAGYESTKVENNAGTSTTKVTNLALGLRHTF